MARSLDDDRLLGEVLTMTGYASISGPRSVQLVERNVEACRLADASGDPTQRVLSRVFLGAARMTVGDFEKCAQITRDMVAIADADASPFIRWVARANSIRVPCLAGCLDEAHAINDQALALSVELGQGDGEQWWAATSVGLMWLRGEVSSLADAVGDFADQYPLAPVWRCAHAWVLSEAGRYDEARAVIRDHGLDPAHLIMEPMPFVATYQLAQAAYRLDDADLGARVVNALSPHRGLWSHYFMFVMGPISWALGLARAAARDLDGAVADLEEGLAEFAEHDLRGHVPTARLHLARVLRRRDGPGDAARATELLALARDEATALQADSLTASVDALGD